MASRWPKLVSNLAGCVRANHSLSIRNRLGNRWSSSSRHVGTKAVTREWNPFIWYNKMLEKYPIRTKCITSGVLYAVGDYIAQKSVATQNNSVDDKHLLRATIYGSIILAPLAHVHFDFLEWLVVKKIATRASLAPFVKMVIDQFGYWAPMIIVVYHASMGAMEGLSYNETVDRLKTLFWPTLKACWILWPVVMVVNFKLIPVAHQLNFCLAFSLVWATILSVMRAPSSNKTEDISPASIASCPVEATQR